MTISISATISTAVNVPFGGERYVETAVEALTEREYLLSEAITAAVVGHFGVDPEQVTSRLEGLGMAVRPAPEPEPVVTEPEVADLELAYRSDDSTATSGAFIGTDKLKGGKSKGTKKLAKRVKALEKIARNHGLI